MPRIDRRSLRAGLRIDLPEDPLSRRVFRTALRAHFLGNVATIVVVLLVPGLGPAERRDLLAAVVLITLAVGVLAFTLGRTRPEVAWWIASLLNLAAAFAVVLLLPELYVVGVIAALMSVASATAVGGLAIGLVQSAVAIGVTIVGRFVATGPSDVATLTCWLGIAAFPSVAFSIDGYTLNRHRALAQLSQLLDTLRAVSSEPSLAPTLDSVTDAIREAFGCDTVSILLRDGDSLELVTPTAGLARGWDLERVRRATTSAPLGDRNSTPMAYALAATETVVVHDIESEPRFDAQGRLWKDRLLGFGLHSMVVVPLRNAVGTVGVLHVCFARPGALDHNELALLEAYAEQAVVLITRAQAYAQLEAADALKGEFVATVSHELRTPLTATKGFVDTVLLQWDRLDDDQRKRLLERASANADELTRLIDQLLDSSRLDTGTVRVFPVDLELAPVIGALLARMDPVLAEHRVVVEADRGIVVHADADAITHVLGNLLTNAAHFSPAGACIHVTATEVDGEALVSVRDEGVGIDPAEHERIFDRFYRAADTSGTARGTGIGLAVAARYAELLGSHVEVESELGVGSTFSFSLPVVGRDGVTEAAPVAATGRPATRPDQA